MFLAWILKEMQHFCKWTARPAKIAFESVAHLQPLVPTSFVNIQIELKMLQRICAEEQN